MRVRPIAALSVAVAAVLALAGCAAGDAEPDPTASTVASLDLCADVAESGAASEAVEVSGEVGAEPTVTFAAPLEAETLERTVVVEGTGEEIAEGDYVTYAVAAYDAQSGELLESAGYAAGEIAPAPIVAGSVLGDALGCATVGTRVTAVTAATESSSAAVYVIDLLGAVPADKWCQPVEPTDPAAFPTVEFGEDGAPTVTVPAVEPPSEVTLEVLTEGDGETVEAGDDVTVDYHGVKWSDGTVFDSSWDRGEPATFATTQVVAGFGNALVGQKVGSTVLVSMPPSCGYGASTGHELQNETLIFVIDIQAVDQG
ncbi:FKBP-type peptidyl-prolyl cis-trans isomerase [Microbacterium sp. GXF7504]